MSFIRKIRKGGRVYLAEVENQWVNGKVQQKHIRYVGREADGKTILSASISNVEIEEVKLYGPLLVLDYLAKRIGLDQLLGPYASEILSLVYAHCLDYRSINQMERWFQRTDLNVLLNIEGVTEKRLLDALDSLEQLDWDRLQRQIFDTVRDQYKLKVSCIIYDVTNTYLYGKKCSLGKLGHDKEGVKGRPLIQIGLGVTQQEGIPLLHKVYDGNIHDSRTLWDLIPRFKPYGVKSGLLIYDRGITSSRNLREVMTLGWNTLCGMPIRGKLHIVLRRLIGRNQFIQLSNRVKLRKSVFYAVTSSHNVEGVKGTIALCFNEQQRKDLRESRYDEILQAEKLRKERKAIKPGLARFFDRKGNILKGKVLTAEEFDGYSCIFGTAAGLSKEDMVRFYFDKDIVEKAFHALKGIVRLRPIRHWLYDRVHAHVFICYLAYLLLSLLKYHLRDEELSPMEALTELETMYKVYMRDPNKGFRISRVVTLSKKQEQILKTISPTLLAPSV